MRRGPLAVVLALAVTATIATLPSLARGQSTLSALQTDVDQIARRARPSVVTVFAQRTETARGTTPPRVHTRVGSGVAIEESRILTTASVVLGAERLAVRTANGLQADARLVGVDPISNVALLDVPSLRLPALRLAADHPAGIGDWVVSLGTSYRAQPTQSVGNVAYRHHEPHLTLLQLTNTVYPGNSGAAAVNTEGELVGLVQGELGSPELVDDNGEDHPAPGSFAIPVDDLRPVITALERDGRVRHGFLGVTTRAISVASVRQGGPRQPIGAVVEAIVPGSPAEKLGLQRGDLIVAYDHERVEYPEQLARWVGATPPGSAIELVWVREEIAENGTVTLGESPDAVPSWMATWPDEDAAPSATRISELQRQIRKLNAEIDRLKNKSSR
jgi:S1-C subfamily serine protease